MNARIINRTCKITPATVTAFTADGVVTTPLTGTVELTGVEYGECPCGGDRVEIALDVAGQWKVLSACTSDLV